MQDTFMGFVIHMCKYANMIDRSKAVELSFSSPNFGELQISFLSIAMFVSESVKVKNIYVHVNVDEIVINCS